MQSIDLSNRSNPAPIKERRAARAAENLGQMRAGLLQGQPVKQMDMSSVLNNSQKELTQSLSGRVQEKDLRERKASNSDPNQAMGRAQMAAMLMAMKKTDKAQKGEGGNNQLRELAKLIQKDPSKARQVVRQQGGDATTQYLTLLEVAALIAEGTGEPDPGAVAQTAVREAAAELLAEYGNAIWADINTFESAEKLSELSGRDQDAGAFRVAYRDSVLGSASLNDTLRSLLNANNEGQGADFTRMLDTMMQALGLDLAATRPSTDPTRLQAMVSDLFHLKVISTVIDQCATLADTLSERHGTPKFLASGMTADLVALSGERWVDASRVGNLADKYGLSEPLAAQVQFIAGSRKALSELPVQVFQSPEARDAVLGAAQGALDRAIDKEEGLA